MNRGSTANPAGVLICGALEEHLLTYADHRYSLKLIEFLTADLQLCCAVEINDLATDCVHV